MISSSADSNGFRKSSHRFSRAKLASVTPLITKGKGAQESLEAKKDAKRYTFPLGFSMGREAQKDDEASSLSGNTSMSPSTKPRTIQRTRPGSKFGSIGKESILSVDEE